ncbi:hypothetical protein BpHYR1_025154 [Brachionus plicatilis]|uniref:Uncharacterized protein n=1 Tax=Brachionus plicatilis TaxID=10195 RepID=A0A3M7RTX9_BRAPC|nr:hypothetical protein BpHYR1_025154 [Brachionus plicatilis]
MYNVVLNTRSTKTINLEIFGLSVGIISDGLVDFELDGLAGLGVVFDKDFDGLDDFFVQG